MLRLQTVGVAYEHSNARSVVGRLRAMKGIAVVGDDDVEFCDTAERATGCHRFAAALRDGGAAELAAVSEDFERMGDLVAAVDAAAHAAIAYRRQGLRGSALGCAARADALAAHCGGVSTPALRQASERLLLTDREREIVMLSGAGSTGKWRRD
jgi:hypothetical protein